MSKRRSRDWYHELEHTVHLTRLFLVGIVGEKISC